MRVKGLITKYELEILREEEKISPGRLLSVVYDSDDEYEDLVMVEVDVNEDAMTYLFRTGWFSNGTLRELQNLVGNVQEAVMANRAQEFSRQQSERYLTETEYAVRGNDRFNNTKYTRSAARSCYPVSAEVSRGVGFRVVSESRVRRPNRVVRGGRWYSSARYCRSALRRYAWPAERYSSIGVRLLMIKRETKES